MLPVSTTPRCASSNQTEALLATSAGTNVRELSFCARSLFDNLPARFTIHTAPFPKRRSHTSRPSNCRHLEPKENLIGDVILRLAGLAANRQIHTALTPLRPGLPLRQNGRSQTVPRETIPSPPRAVRDCRFCAIPSYWRRTGSGVCAKPYAVRPRYNTADCLGVKLIRRKIVTLHRSETSAVL